MPYPNRLLPKSHFKKIIWSEYLRSQYLVHYTETSDNRDSTTGKLDIRHVVNRTDHLRDFSNNLLGVYLTDDIFWSLQDCENRFYFVADWEIGSNVQIPSVPEEFNRNEKRGYFYLAIDDCHEQIIEFNDETGISTVCLLMHTPTNSNFWHFSLRWFCNGADIIEWTERQRRRILTIAKVFIIERAFFEEPFFEELSSDLYTN